MSVDYGIINGNTLIYIRHKDITTVADFKAWLAQQKANGTPVVVEYNLRTEEIEAYTEEQKTALEQLNKFKTYKNITNIFTDSNAIIDLTYNVYGEKEEFKKAILLKEYDNNLFFGTENGVVAKFEENRYNDNGRLLYSQWQMLSDNFSSDNHIKTTNKRGGIANVKTLPNSVCKLKVVTDKTGEKEITRYASSGFSFENFSFENFSFITTEKSYMKYKIKEKKWLNISLIFYSDELDKPFGIFSATLEAFIGGYLKSTNYL